MPKKFLIISMTSGFGHTRAGEALFAYAKKNLPDYDVQHTDIINIDTSLKKYSNIYDFASKKFPFLWRALYYYVPLPVIKKIVSWGGPLHEKLKSHVLEKKPDVIIFTNFVIMPMFAFLGRMSPRMKIGVVVTDYRGHPYCKFSFVDYYFVPTDQVQKDLENVGIGREKIMVTGIPINPKFYLQENIKDLKIKHGIENQLPVVLFIASFKISKKELLKTLRQLLALKPQINIIFLANGNEEFYNLVKDHFSNTPRFTFLKWTDIIEEYMKISDVVISKAGGLTVSECLALKKPLIMVNPIAGQEEDNVEFMEKNNTGKKVNSLDEIANLAAKMIIVSSKNQAQVGAQKDPSQKIFGAFL